MRGAVVAPGVNHPVSVPGEAGAAQVMHQRLKTQYLLQCIPQGWTSQQQDTVDAIGGGFDTLPQTPAKQRPTLFTGRLQQVQVGRYRNIVIADGGAPERRHQQRVVQPLGMRCIPQRVGIGRHHARAWGGDRD